jgi:hypothetical protein
MAGAKPLCSAALCTNVALQLEPVHLCKACLSKVPSATPLPRRRPNRKA